MLLGTQQVLPLLLLLLVGLWQVVLALPDTGYRPEHRRRLPYESPGEFRSELKTPPFRS